MALPRIQTFDHFISLTLMFKNGQEISYGFVNLNLKSQWSTNEDKKEENLTTETK